jgi:DNA-binding beta-propeller fold protein YncE
VFVIEHTGNRIVKVSPGGKVQRLADVERPVGMVLGRSGDLYVAQPFAGRISKIKPDGTRITLLEDLKEPRDPAFDKAGILYVAETKTGRILKLSGDY